MTPRDPLNLPLRWVFKPQESAADRAVHWTWEAWSQAGKLVQSSQRSFDTLSDCIADAREHGYGAGG